MYNTIAMFLFVTLTACGSHDDRVTFITSTQIGIDADPNTQQIDIGYSRMEGVIGPVYQSGAVPPVYSEIESNLSVLNPRIKQFYATGDAAEIATGSDPKNADDDRYKLTGSRKTMFFGTSSNFGLRAGFTTGGSPSVNLGYKRQELSIIPIINNGDQGDRYGSTYARIDFGAEISEFNQTGVALSQLFATGKAADQLANQDAVKNNLMAKAAAAADLSCGASDTVEAAKLQTNISSNPPNQAKLRNWMDKNGLQKVSYTVFAYGDCFPQKQTQAVADLGW